MANSLIKYKGLADIAVAAILTFKPSLIYDSAVTHALHGWTGLHLSSASAAPGFNQSVACMVAAVGVGHVVASGEGKSGSSIILAMNLTWAILGGLTCLTPKELQLGSATLLMSAINHTVFSLALYWVTSQGVDEGKKKQ